MHIRGAAVTASLLCSLESFDGGPSAVAAW